MYQHHELLVSPQRSRQLSEHTLTVCAPELCNYPGGDVDGKYIDLTFLEQVAGRGSEPARFALSRRPRALLAQRIDRGRAGAGSSTISSRVSRSECDASMPGSKHGTGMSPRPQDGTTPICSGFPWGNWSCSEADSSRREITSSIHPTGRFVRVFAAAQDKPEELMTRIERLYKTGDAALASELNWLQGRTPVDELSTRDCARGEWSPGCMLGHGNLLQRGGYR